MLAEEAADQGASDEVADSEFDDVEAFLAEHNLNQDVLEEAVSETEAAEALAISWKERRSEINRLNKSRQFSAADSSRRSFRVEVAELKRRTKCRKCGRVGHWARECRGRTNASGQPLQSGSLNSASSGVSTSKMPSETLFVQTASAQEVDSENTVQDQIYFVGAAEEEVMAASLVSSPGHGVVDSGCGKTLIGEETLRAMEPLLRGRKVIRSEQKNSFRFGNGALEESTVMARIPVAIQQKTGVVDAAVIKGKAPLLLGRPTLERLGMILNFQEGSALLLGDQVPVKLTRNSAGQLLIDLTQFPDAPQLCSANTPEVLAAQTTQEPASLSLKCPKDPKFPNSLEVAQQGGKPNPVNPKSPKDPKLKKKDTRNLLTQWKRQSPPPQEDLQSPVIVAELFSPPRFRTEAERLGFRGFSFDLVEGWDLLDVRVQREVDRLLDRARPELLVACPLCKHMGGWHRLNASKLCPLERARVIRVARAQARYAAEQCHKQLKRGGRILFEHPWGSSIWKYEPVRALVKKFGVNKVDMCAYGLVDPGSQTPMQKTTGVLLSDPDMKRQCRQCSGDHDHQTIEGTSATGEARSVIAGRYTPSFVRAFLSPITQGRTECLYTLVEEPQEAVSLEGYECLSGGDGSQAVAEPNVSDPGQPVSAESPLDPIGLALKKLHNNLGHPSQASLLRVLKNSGASAEALQRASTFRCQTCEAAKKPADSLPASPAGAEGFNDRVGIDVKYLPAWKAGEKVPCLNIIDYGSSFQQMIPLPGRETGDMIRQVYRRFWLSWAGPPQELILDPSQPHLSEALGQPCEDEGTRVRHTAAEAHWQTGKVERHGGLFATVLARVLAEVSPANEAEWQECVTQTTWAKNSMLNVSGVSPFQFVFGRNPRIPADLLVDNPNPIANDAVLTDSAVDSQQRIRLAARQALVASQDCRALRDALRARPRLRRDFESGQWVAYWHTQKLEKGKIVRGRRWYGPALVLGKVGKNVIVAHRRSILRCAPEQLRPATAEERPPAEALDDEGRELLGMQQLLDQGKFPRNQLIDLTRQGFPPTPEESIPALPLGAARVQSADRPAGQTAAELVDQPGDVPMPSPEAASTNSSPGPSTGTPSAAEAPQYAPVRTRASRKTKPGEYNLVRPVSFQPEDLSEMLGEVLPKVLQGPDPEPLPEGDVNSPREPAFKRAASSAPDELREASREQATEVLFCQETMKNFRDSHPQATAVEVLLAGFMQKKLQKELPVVNNPPELQEEIEEAKGAEWCTMCSKPAVRVWSGAEADRIRKQRADRFIGSRFVVTRKEDEEGSRVKARWCLQGHLDPDFKAKILSFSYHVPAVTCFTSADSSQQAMAHVPRRYKRGILRSRTAQASISSPLRSPASGRSPRARSQRCHRSNWQRIWPE